jgi:anti-sigma factor RsiW
MTDWTERLSDYLDDDLSGDERARLEAALEGDAELRRVLDELRTVKQEAASLFQRAPDTDLWTGIESRIRGASDEDAGVIELASRKRRRFSFTVPQLAAAAVALLMVGSVSVWMAVGAGSGDSAPQTAVSAPPEAGFVSLPPAEGPVLSYETAIRDLEQQLQVGRDRLDPATVEALERSLATIDRAIGRAQEALDADPASMYLNRHLADARARKIRVLQQAARLASS